LKDIIMTGDAVSLFSPRVAKWNTADGVGRFKHLLVVMLLATSLSSAIGSSPARADLVSNHMLPQFSQAELQIILSDGLLRTALSDTPWLLLRALQIGACSTTGGNTNQPGGAGACPTTPSAATPHDEPVDRANPEAAYDLFMLLKKVKETQSK